MSIHPLFPTDLKVVPPHLSIGPLFPRHQQTSLNDPVGQVLEHRGVGEELVKVPTNPGNLRPPENIIVVVKLISFISIIVNLIVHNSKPL